MLASRPRWNSENVPCAASTCACRRVTTSTSDIASNDLLAAMKYPDKSTGDPSSREQETYTVNRLGEVKTKAVREWVCPECDHFEEVEES